MKKIKLNLNQLKVDSFEISKANSESGTIHGNAFTEYPCPSQNNTLCLTCGGGACPTRDFDCTF